MEEERAVTSHSHTSAIPFLLAYLLL